MFSVVIPVHNKLPHLDRSINSVLNQTFQDFELILIDDASTDGSSEKLLEYKDPRIRIFRRETPGPGGYAARNLGIEKAKFEWISFLDADDEWSDNYLSEVNATIKKFPTVHILSCKWQSVPKKTRNSKLVMKEDFREFTLTDYLNNPNLMWTGAITMRKSLLEESGLFPVGRYKRGGDIDTWVRCLYYSSLSIFINKTLSYYHKETVNRVTNDSSNLPKTFHALESLKKITSNTKDKRLKKAIQRFTNKRIYSIQSVRVRANKPIDKTLLMEITPFYNRMLTYGKLLLRRILKK